ncbi:MAG: hypothetical protein KF777_14470 [Planctomycetaceae bacterium]|nr:hypothetical protein [Planctomycetaceae bacterium]
MSASSHVPTSGQIVNGIEPNTFVAKTVKFVEEQLPQWRDDKSRPVVEAEEDMNGQLCKFLNDRARDHFPMANFHHEEKQGKRRRVDLSVVPSTKAIEVALYDSIYVPFLVIEGKRLPAPSVSREREYVTGLGKVSGGIQRFRMGLHGRDLSKALMVAYVQKEDVAEWHTRINGWITALESTGEDKTCDWTGSDSLSDLVTNGVSKTCRCESSHLRKDLLGIRLVHLWVCMPSKAKITKKTKNYPV